VEKFFTRNKIHMCTDVEDLLAGQTNIENGNLLLRLGLGALLINSLALNINIAISKVRMFHSTDTYYSWSSTFLIIGSMDEGGLTFSVLVTV
jgi:uncharacterized protein (DUF779 family)